MHNVCALWPGIGAQFGKTRDETRATLAPIAMVTECADCMLERCNFLVCGFWTASGIGSNRIVIILLLLLWERSGGGSSNSSSSSVLGTVSVTLHHGLFCFVVMLRFNQHHAKPATGPTSKRLVIEWNGRAWWGYNAPFISLCVCVCVSCVYVGCCALCIAIRGRGRKGRWGPTHGVCCVGGVRLYEIRNNEERRCVVLTVSKGKDAVVPHLP